MAALMPALEGYRGELAVERERQVEIKQKYGLTSLDHLIFQLDGELIQLYDRRDRGENVDAGHTQQGRAEGWLSSGPTVS